MLARRRSIRGASRRRGRPGTFVLLAKAFGRSYVARPMQLGVVQHVRPAGPEEIPGRLAGRILGAREEPQRRRVDRRPVSGARARRDFGRRRGPIPSPARRQAYRRQGRHRGIPRQGLHRRANDGGAERRGHGALARPVLRRIARPHHTANRQGKRDGGGNHQSTSDHCSNPRQRRNIIRKRLRMGKWHA